MTIGVLPHMKKRNDTAVDSKVKALGDKDLQNLYSLSTIKKLKGGDLLFTENTSEPFVYLFVEGEITLLKEISGNIQEIIRLRQGKGGQDIAFMPHTPWPVTVKAIQPSTVLVLKSAVFESMDDRIKHHFYKRDYRLDPDLIDQFLAAKSKVHRNREWFQSYMLFLQTDAKADYENSELISGILEKIPRLPAFTSQLAASLMDDRISAKEVAELVKEDPSLAAVVLKTVNSPFYGFGKNISDINHAIILLGFNELYQLVIAEGVNRSMPNSPNIRDLFIHSICISRIAFALSMGSRVGKPAEVSTIGLLHDLGKSVKHLLQKQNPKLHMLIEYIDTAAIGAVMMERWNLPARVWQSIELQNYPKFASPDKIPGPFRTNVAALYLSHRCYDLFLEREDTLVDSPFTEDYVRLFVAEDGSTQHVAKKIILPVLIKHLESFPAFFRKIITKHTHRYDVLN